VGLHEEMLNFQFEVVERQMFNETKGKELAIRCMKSSDTTNSAILQMYLALSCFFCVNCFLDRNFNSSIMEKYGEDIKMEHHVSNAFLNLDQKTCISLNLFGDKNSMVQLFKPMSNMGKRLIKRRINSPSANPQKIENWYENLR